MEKIGEIDIELRKGNNKSSIRHQSNTMNVLEDALTMIKKDHFYNELQRSIVEEKEADIIKIK